MDNQGAGNYPKEKVNQYWQGCFLRLVILVSIPPIFYVGYCFGLWGRNSLLFQHFFQCNCPVFSEELRYPKGVDVIISACQYAGIRLSPNGYLVFVYDKASNNASNYILDIRINEMTHSSLPDGKYYFLNDNLLYVFVGYGGSYEGGDYIFDLTTNNMYPIQKFVYAHPASYVNGKADLAKLAEALREVDDVYYIENSDLIIALSSDFHNSSERNFLSGWLDIPGINQEEKFLQQNDINYKVVHADFPNEAVSPNGKFLARKDGIYLVQSNQKIVEGIPRQLVRSWTSDSEGVIYSTYGSPCLLRLGFPFADDTWCEIKVPQPVLLLKVPEKYLLPEPMP